MIFSLGAHRRGGGGTAAVGSGEVLGGAPANSGGSGTADGGRLEVAVSGVSSTSSPAPCIGGDGRLEAVAVPRTPAALPVVLLRKKEGERGAAKRGEGRGS
jgi:hypothetical protein